jgi:hypothetical protein
VHSQFNNWESDCQPTNPNLLPWTDCLLPQKGKWKAMRHCTRAAAPTFNPAVKLLLLPFSTIVFSSGAVCCRQGNSHHQFSPILSLLTNPWPAPCSGRYPQVSHTTSSSWWHVGPLDLLIPADAPLRVSVWMGVAVAESEGVSEWVRWEHVPCEAARIIRCSASVVVLLQ